MSESEESDSERPDFGAFIAAMTGHRLPTPDELDRQKATVDLETHTRLRVFREFNEEQLTVLRLTLGTMKGTTAAYWTGIVDGLLMNLGYCPACHASCGFSAESYPDAAAGAS